MIVLYILLALAVLLFMVLVHEFGHYCIGRMLNFKITEFYVGFGKALFSRKNKRGELISLRLFPLGGYCAFAGEDETSKDDKDAFTNQKPWKRILVFLAGVTFNFATAVIFSFILLCTMGYDIPQAKSFVPTSEFAKEFELEIVGDPISVAIAEEEKLQVGDVIISIDGKKIDFAYGSTYNDLIKDKINTLTKENFEQEGFVKAVVKRDGEYKNVKIAFFMVESLKDGKTETNFIWNVNAKAYVHTVGEAIERAVPFAIGLGWVVLKSLFMLLTFQLSIKDIGGPVTTIALIASTTQANFANLLILIPLISANLAVFNILPIPALDGAHVLFTTIEAIRKKPIKREVENMIHTIGLFILFGAVVLIDILHFLL